jgi:death on curing protein
MPREFFGERFVHRSIAEMAAAYMFHLCMNHAFEDGNKRVAVFAALTFLTLNEHDVQATLDELEALTLATAAGQLKKDDVVAFFKDRVRKPRRR